MCGHAAGFDPPSDHWTIRAGMRLWLGGNNVAARRLAAPLLVGTSRPAEGPLDAAIITPLTWDEACYFLEKLAPRLTPNGVAWIVEPSSDTPSIRPALDQDPRVAGFSWFATVAPDPTLLAHGYRSAP